MEIDSVIFSSMGGCEFEYWSTVLSLFVSGSKYGRSRGLGWEREGIEYIRVVSVYSCKGTDIRLWASCGLPENNLQGLAFS